MKMMASRLVLIALVMGVALAVPLDRFEAEIRAYEALPRPAPGGTVFVGSSTIRLWGPALEREFASFRAVNRGFGGATIAEITHYYPRLIKPLEPSRLIFYAGTNDVAEGHSAAQILQDYRAFVQTAGVPVAFVSMSIPPSRVQYTTVYQEANRLIREAGYAYIDVSHCVQDASGQPREELFLEDRLHMRPEGYALWAPILRRYLEESCRPRP